MEKSKLVIVDYTDPSLIRNILENVIAYFIPRIGKVVPSNPIYALNWLFISQEKVLLGIIDARFMLLSPL